jgi:hypothetical protein
MRPQRSPKQDEGRSRCVPCPLPSFTLLAAAWILRRYRAIPVGPSRTAWTRQNTEAAPLSDRPASATIDFVLQTRRRPRESACGNVERVVAHATGLKGAIHCLQTCPFAELDSISPPSRISQQHIEPEMVWIHCEISAGIAGAD